MENLLQHKDFEQLTPTEKAQVLAEMSEMDYRAQRKVVLATQSLRAKTEQLKPNPLLLHQLRGKFEPEAKRIPIWQRGVPVWAVAASLLAVVALAALWKKEPKVEQIYVENTKVVHDTLLQKTPYKKVVFKTKYEQIIIDNTQKINDLDKNIFQQKENIPDFDFAEKDIETSISEGKSVAEDTLTWAILMRLK